MKSAGTRETAIDLPYCANCGTALAGPFCHSCGQARATGRTEASDFLRDLSRRVLRLDIAYAKTICRALRSPGALVDDYLNGRRGSIQDPLQYFISCAFTQVVVSSLTLVLAPLTGHTAALSWLAVLGGVVAIKLLSIVCVGFLWWTLFRGRQRTLGEILVFMTYVDATTSLLWSSLPLIDLMLPIDLARSEHAVGLITLCVEVLYATYAVHSWLHRPVVYAFAGVTAVLGTGYLLLAVIPGTQHVVTLAPLAALLAPLIVARS